MATMMSDARTWARLGLRNFADKAAKKAASLRRTCNPDVIPSSLQMCQELQELSREADGLAFKRLVPEIVTEQELNALETAVKAWASGKLKSEKAWEDIHSTVFRKHTMKTIDFANALATVQDCPDERLYENMPLDLILNITAAKQAEEVFTFVKDKVFGADVVNPDTAWRLAVREMEISVVPRGAPFAKEVQMKFADGIAAVLGEQPTGEAGPQVEIFVWLEVVRLCTCVEVLRHINVPSLPVLLGPGKAEAEANVFGKHETSPLMGEAGEAGEASKLRLRTKSSS